LEVITSEGDETATVFVEQVGFEGETSSNKLLTIKKRALKITLYRPDCLEGIYVTGMDRDTPGSTGNMPQRNQACPSCELSQETKELCKEIGKMLARIGDRINTLQMTRNGHNLHMNCLNGERINDDDTRPRPGVNKLP
ncbi:hypothetical protein ACROYT_G034170, partial [Oculina patagonica]